MMSNNDEITFCYVTMKKCKTQKNHIILYSAFHTEKKHTRTGRAIHKQKRKQKICCLKTCFVNL